MQLFFNCKLLRYVLETLSNEALIRNKLFRKKMSLVGKDVDVIFEI